MKPTRLYLPSLLLIAAAAILSLWSYPLLPGQIAVHFGPNGMADGYLSKGWGLIILPLVMIITAASMQISPRLDSNPAVHERVRSGLLLVQEILLGLLLALHAASILFNLGYPVPMLKAGLLFAGVLFIVIGNYMPRMQPSRHIGIRTRWTLASEQNWRQTHAAASKVWVAGGLLMLACLLLPPGFVVYAICGIAALVLGLSLLLSYTFYRRAR